jgi:hypothetical protein
LWLWLLLMLVATPFSVRGCAFLMLSRKQNRFRGIQKVIIHKSV